MEKMKKWDDAPSNKRKASKEVNPLSGKLVRQDACANFAGTAEQRARLLAAGIEIDLDPLETAVVHRDCIEIIDEDGDVVDVIGSDQSEDLSAM